MAAAALYQVDDASRSAISRSPLLNDFPLWKLVMFVAVLIYLQQKQLRPQG